ncbi:bis(5'-nucleosyl)-tetraphosphatase, partial [Striga asiatica]
MNHLLIPFSVVQGVSVPLSSQAVELHKTLVSIVIQSPHHPILLKKKHSHGTIFYKENKQTAFSCLAALALLICNCKSKGSEKNEGKGAEVPDRGDDGCDSDGGDSDGGDEGSETIDSDFDLRSE